MSQSRRTKRMEKRHHRKSFDPPMMLTSLMDIFTVLVVFLLASSSSGSQMPNNKFIKLPDSTAITQPEQTVVIQVSEKAIIMQGKKIADVPAVMNSDKPDIPALVKELEYRAHLASLSSNKDSDEPRKVKIMGDKSIPFSLLKKVMVSCTETVYTKISFAALMTAEKSS